MVWALISHECISATSLQKFPNSYFSLAFSKWNEMVWARFNTKPVLSGFSVLLKCKHFIPVSLTLNA